MADPRSTPSIFIPRPDHEPEDSRARPELTAPRRPPAMYRDQRITVVIPCYNEEDGVRQVIGRLPREVDEVVVVDNNCTDGTAEVARSLGAVVVPERTPGYGAAY